MKLLGYRKFKAKNGKEYCVANVTSSYGEREKNSGCVGAKVEEVFLPEERTHFLTPADVGKEIKLDYEISNGRAYIVDIAVVK